MTNNSSTVFDKSEVAYKGWAALVVNTVSLAGLFGYLLYAYIVIKFRSSFKNPFYTLALSMMVSDLINIVTEIMFSVPALLLGEEGMPDTYRIVVGFFADGAWFWSSSHLTFIAANRVAAVCFYTRYLHLFSPKKVRILIISSVIYGFIIIGMMYGCTCQYHFKPYAWNFECQENSCQKTALDINQVVSNGAVVVVIVCMVIVVVAVRRAARKVKIDNKSLDKQQKREIQLVIQFLVIGLVLTLQQIFFWTFPKMVDAKIISEYVSLNLINVFNLLNSCVHPFLYIFCGSEVKQKIFVTKTTPEAYGNQTTKGAAGGSTVANAKDLGNKNVINNVRDECDVEGI